MVKHNVFGSHWQLLQVLAILTIGDMAISDVNLPAVCICCAGMCFATAHQLKRIVLVVHPPPAYLGPDLSLTK